MNEGNLQDELLRQTTEACRRDADLEAELERRGAEPPRPGDVYLFRETADQMIEWAVVSGSAAGSFLMLAADSVPLWGSGDIEVPAGAALGPRTLRCGYSVRLDSHAFEPELRIGSLDAAVVARARKKQRLVETGSLAGSLDEEEVDSDPEYVEWQEVLAAARAAVSRRVRPEPHADASRAARPRWESISSPLAMAASVMLVLTLGMALGWFSEARRSGELAVELELARPAPIVNPPWAILQPGRDRSETERLVVHPEGQWILVTLYLPATEPQDQLQIRNEDSHSLVWSTDQLAKENPSPETMILLPRALLPAGQYRLSLLRGRGGEEEVVARYRLLVEDR